MKKEDENYNMLAQTLHGLEEVLEKELKVLGAMDVKKGNRAVSFRGDKGFMYKANLWLRTALRILKPIHHFRAYRLDEQELYKRLSKINWSDYMTIDDTFSIDTAVHSTHFPHTKFPALKAKDAIVDQFREKTGMRPDVNTENPDITIHLHIRENECTISLNSSGDHLYKRGYRSATNEAPLNEVLAAGMIALSEWPGHGNFIDPMCGSGTILIEAAMIGCNIPAGIHREHFGFMNWQDFDQDLWEKILDVSLNKEKNFFGKIIGYDTNARTIDKAEQNIVNALFEDIIEVHHADFFDTKKPENEYATQLVFNPPYGERLKVDTNALYSLIGDTLKTHYQDSNAWMITSDLDALKNVGLRPSRKIKLYQGKMECRFVKYEMYKGSKKAKKQ